MNSDLYARLDLPRDATPEQVKKAYKRKVRECHPDAGGSAEAFRLVQEAYDTLGDEAARARYDATGDFSTAAGLRDKAAEILASLFANLLASEMCVPSRDNLLEIAQRLVKEAMEASAKAHQAARGKASALRDAAARFTAKGGADNIPAAVLERQAEEADKAAARCDKEFEVLQESERMLSSYSYRTDGTAGFGYVSIIPVYSRFTK